MIECTASSSVIEEKESDESMWQEVQESLKTRKTNYTEEQRKIQLDAFFLKMQREVEQRKREALRKQEEERYTKEMVLITERNKQYNIVENTPLITMDVVLARIIRAAPLNLIRTLCCTSKSFSPSIVLILKRWPINSIEVGSKFSFLVALRLFPSSHSPVMTEIKKNLSTVRYKIRGKHEDLGYLKKVVNYNIKEIILNVSHDDELAWFLNSFASYNRQFTVYHQPEHWAPSSKELSYTVVNRKLNLNPIIKDPDGLLFRCIPNFIAQIEVESETSVK